MRAIWAPCELPDVLGKPAFCVWSENRNIAGFASAKSSKNPGHPSILQLLGLCSTSFARKGVPQSGRGTIVPIFPEMPRPFSFNWFSHKSVHQETETPAPTVVSPSSTSLALGSSGPTQPTGAQPGCRTQSEKDSGWMQRPTACVPTCQQPVPPHHSKSAAMPFCTTPRWGTEHLLDRADHSRRPGIYSQTVTVAHPSGLLVHVLKHALWLRLGASHCWIYWWIYSVRIELSHFPGRVPRVMQTQQPAP